MAPKRKADSALETDTPAQKKAKGQPPSNLVPDGDRVKAVKGQKNPDMLRMLCTDKKTGKRKELHFKKLIHSEIDWNDAEHIAKINSWRNQLYGRAGFKAKDVCMWDAEEEAYLELYFHRIIVQGTKEGLMIPRAKDVLDDFNNFFIGKVFIKREEQQEPRKARQHNAFVSKMNRVVQHLKTRLEYMMLGKSGDYYRPIITQPMLDKYMVLRKDLKDSNVMTNGPAIDWEVDFEAGDEWANNEHWQKFWQGVLGLPALAEQESEDLDAELDEKLVELNVDMDEEHNVKEEDTSDVGKQDALPSLIIEPANTIVESNAGNESTFVEDDTGITEPDAAVREVVADKATSDFSTALLATDKVDYVQLQDAGSTKLDLVTESVAQVDESSQETLIGDESEGKSHHYRSMQSIQEMLTSL